MRDLRIGDSTLKLAARQQDGGWVASAVRADTAERFGIECAGDSQLEAEHRLVRWLEWQNEHIQALTALQEAERAYHRTIAGSAFATPVAPDGATAPEQQKGSLDQVEAARTRLDAIRAQRPE